MAIEIYLQLLVTVDASTTKFVQIKLYIVYFKVASQLTISINIVIRTLKPQNTYYWKKKNFLKKFRPLQSIKNLQNNFKNIILKSGQNRIF